MSNKTIPNKGNSAITLIVVMFLVAAAVLGYNLSTKIKTDNTAFMNDNASSESKNLLTFQNFLSDNCMNLGNAAMSEDTKVYGIKLDKLPIMLGSELKTQYGIEDTLNCLNGGTSFEIGKKNRELYVSAKKETDDIKATLYIGDDYSTNPGFRTPSLTYDKHYEAYYKPYNRTPYTLEDAEGIKTIVSFSIPEPFCPSEKDRFILEFLTYKKLDKYNLLVKRAYSFLLDKQMATMLMQYATPVDEVDTENGMGIAEVCTTGGFTNEFNATYLPSYEDATPQFKQIIDANINDLNSISVK